MLKKILSKYKLKKAMLQEAERDGSHFDNAVVAWEAPLRHKTQKGGLWVALMTIAIAGLIYFGITTNNWIFVVAIIAAVIAYTVDHREDAREVEIKISEMGIKIGKKNIPYSNIRAFWVVYHPPFVSRLHIRTYQKMLPDITIELMGIDPTLIRKHLTRHIIEWEGKDEGFMDICTRLLRL